MGKLIYVTVPKGMEAAKRSTLRRATGLTRVLGVILHVETKDGVEKATMGVRAGFLTNVSAIDLAKCDQPHLGADLLKQYAEELDPKSHWTPSLVKRCTWPAAWAIECEHLSVPDTDEGVIGGQTNVAMDDVAVNADEEMIDPEEPVDVAMDVENTAEGASACQGPANMTTDDIGEVEAEEILDDVMVTDDVGDMGAADDATRAAHALLSLAAPLASVPNAARHAPLANARSGSAPRSSRPAAVPRYFSRLFEANVCEGYTWCCF